MTRKAMPAQDKFPVRSHTTKAMTPAGRKKNKTFAINTMMMNPMAKSIKSKINSGDRGKDMQRTLQPYRFRFSVIKSFDTKNKGQKRNIIMYIAGGRNQLTTSARMWFCPSGFAADCQLRDHRSEFSPKIFSSSSEDFDFYVLSKNFTALGCEFAD